MTSTEVVLQFVDAINAHDVERLCRLMSDDHLFVDGSGDHFRGRETMRSSWRGYLSMVPDYRIEVERIVAEGPVVMLAGTAHGTYTPHGDPSPENRWSTPAAWRAELAGERVSVWQVYADNEPIRRLIRRHRGASD